MADNLLKMVIYGIAGGSIAWLAGLALKFIGYKAPASNQVNRSVVPAIVVAAIIVALVALPIWYHSKCAEKCRGSIASWLGK